MEIHLLILTHSSNFHMGVDQNTSVHSFLDYRHRHITLQPFLSHWIIFLRLILELFIRTRCWIVSFCFFLVGVVETWICWWWFGSILSRTETNTLGVLLVWNMVEIFTLIFSSWYREGWVRIIFSWRHTTIKSLKSPMCFGNHERVLRGKL